MATTYKLVQRRDMHKGATEGDKLYYAQAKSTGTSDMERFLLHDWRAFLRI